VPQFDLEAARKVFRAAPFVADVGIEPTAIGDGECETALELQPRHLQRGGQVHAGVITTMADHSAGAAAFTLTDGGGAVVTADMHVSLLRAAKGERLLCRAWVVKPGRLIMFTEAEVHCVAGGESQLVARFSATMAVVSSR
jgi:uncharacterized protein (TIGR00369 family)